MLPSIAEQRRRTRLRPASRRRDWRRDDDVRLDRERRYCTR